MIEIPEELQNVGTPDGSDKWRMRWVHKASDRTLAWNVRLSVWEALCYDWESSMAFILIAEPQPTVEGWLVRDNGGCCFKPDLPFFAGGEWCRQGWYDVSTFSIPESDWPPMNGSKRYTLAVEKVAGEV